jgi:branched-chain amino acid transport system ATP-binding protein
VSVSAMPPPAELLRVQGLCSGYGVSQVLFGVDLRIGEGEILGLLGRNGMGKTTFVRSVLGLIKPTQGTIAFGDRAIGGMAPHRVARQGIAVVPEGRQVFGNLSVLEHLTAFRRGQADPSRAWTPERLFELFPRLAERRAHMGGQLSGGEQQMLAIGRILRTGASFLLLDEPTEGLAPVIIEQIGRTIARLKREGFTIILVEQNFRFASTVADRYYVMEHGRIIDQFANSELEANVEKLHDYLGV